MIDWSEWHYEPKSEQELVQICQGIADGEIFTSDHVKADDAHMLPEIFIATGMLGSMAFSAAMRREDIEMFYANMDARGPWTKGDYPVFLSCGFLNKLETERIRASLRTAFENRQAELEAQRIANNKEEDEAAD